MSEGTSEGTPERSPVVLLVDDDAVMTRLLEVNFRLAGFRVGIASSGDAALERMQAVPPDAVVLDVMLPGLDGYEVCRQMRQRPSLAKVPVVFLSARAEGDDRVQADVTGPVDHIAKPFELVDLVELVRRRVDERSGS
ncbi:MAG: response regulator [Actinomycetota bacterium]